MDPYYRVNGPFLQECVICLTDLDDDTNEVVAHGNERLHPIHLKCLQEWFKVKHTCPKCRVTADCDSLLSLKQRLIKKISPVLCGLRTGFTMGVISSWPVFAFSPSEKGKLAACSLINMFMMSVLIMEPRELAGFKVPILIRKPKNVIEVAVAIAVLGGLFCLCESQVGRRFKV